ncbi:MAG: zinc-ribbon domain containing protein [Gammaproteobacteria bacterium]
MKSGRQRRIELRARRQKRAAKSAGSMGTVCPCGDTNGTAPCNPELLAPYNSYGSPRFVEMGYYVDRSFICRDCGRQEIWKAAQQKWWYETAKGHVESCAIRCHQCRSIERKRQAEARRVHLEGLSKKLKSHHHSIRQQ